MYVNTPNRLGDPNLDANALLANVTMPQALPAVSSSLFMLGGAIGLAALLWWGSAAKSTAKRVGRKYRRIKAGITE